MKKRKTIPKQKPRKQYKKLLERLEAAEREIVKWRGYADLYRNKWINEQSKLDHYASALGRLERDILGRKR